MSVIDIVLAAIILFGLVRGFMKGLFVEVASLIALVAGVYGAIHFSFYAANFLNDKVNWDQKTVNVIAFAVTFILIIFIISLAGKAFTKLANFAALGIINKLLGGVFGALKFGLILSVILIVFDKFNATITFTDQETLNESVLYKPVKNLTPTLFPEILNLTKTNTDT